MEYNFNQIEQKWQAQWKANNTYKVFNSSDKPKYYVLDMFPYPSGAGLHVGHPLGYIASDIYSRYKRLKGFNVLHPMGFDSFGLPAEQYAIETGQHPAETTKNNIATFKAQLDKIGFCYDWSREIRTSDAAYYKWTQWIFLEIFHSYFNRATNKATPIEQLEKQFETTGNPEPYYATVQPFTAMEWMHYTHQQQQEILMEYRLAFSKYGEVNWCEALGTVLANDEVINGVSERGRHTVVKKKMRQWYLRITDYADRLLQGLDTVDFSDSMKEMQKNWIGKSVGAEITFSITDSLSYGGSPGGEGIGLATSPSHGGEEVGLTPSPSPGGEGSGNAPVKHGIFQTADKSAWTILKDLSRENRKNKTEAEDILWQVLRNNQLGYKVRRQHVIDGFIIDFAYLNQKLLIEADRDYHNQEDQQQYDGARTEFLAAKGYTVVRFSNDELTSDINTVIAKIKKLLEKPQTSGLSTPLSARRGVGGEATKLKVYTTRPDTIFGVDFMVVAPELDLVQQIKSDEQATAVDEYIAYVKSRSDIDRMAEKKITGCFTGAYAVNPFDGKQIPIYISEYVLSGYGTGAIMAVPCGDERDFKFAKHFNIPVTNIIGSYFNGQEANATKEAILENSGFLNGVKMMDASAIVLQKLEEQGIGKRKVNYRMRDAGFSRQRYWGEPFPIIWSNGVAIPLDAEELPLELPHVDKYGPGPDGEGPLGNITEWVNLPSPSGEGMGVRRETSTMPGYAGSSWYFLRYMDPENNTTFCDRKASDYWNQVDLYIGGTEHAVGHLLYSRLWTKILFDLGHIGFDEPFKKLLNQGMIQGSSRLYYWVAFDMTNKLWAEDSIFPKINLSKGWNTITTELKEKVHDILVNHRFDGNLPFQINRSHVNVNIVDGIELNINKLTKDKYKSSQTKDYFVLEDGSIFSSEEKYSGTSTFICEAETEKMSKRYFNTVDPVDLCNDYGADTFRMYEMFLGPVEQSKPWDTKGIEGVHRFLRKLWRLFFDDVKGKVWISSAPSLLEKSGGEVTSAELKVLHKTIKKIEEDTERFSFNTAVSTFMICVNELADLKCHKKEILENVLILLTPYAPHIAEELWQQLGNESSVLDAAYPTFNPALLVESNKEYPVSINGKVRTNINLSLDLQQADVEKVIAENDIIQKWLEGKSPKKVIYVKNKMINVVV